MDGRMDRECGLVEHSVRTAIQHLTRMRDEEKIRCLHQSEVLAEGVYLRARTKPEYSITFVLQVPKELQPYPEAFGIDRVAHTVASSHLLAKISECRQQRT